MIGGDITKKKVGRPTIFDEITLSKLEEAFAIGATDPEACFYANIAPSTLYKYQLKHPEFVERKNALKERPVLLARQTVVNAMISNPNIATWFLERKSPEFRAKQDLNVMNDEEKTVPLTKIANQLQELVKLAKGRYPTEKQRIEEGRIVPV